MMQKYEKKFINELGNQITVQVEESSISGVNGVTISIIGPTSEVENHITLVEARVVHEQLGLLIEKIK
jgi:hypothetical protein